MSTENVTPPSDTTPPADTSVLTDPPSDKPADTKVDAKPDDAKPDTKADAKPDQAPAPKAGQIVAVDKDGKVTYTDPTAAPETYADFKVPEGYKLDTDLLGEFAPVLKELNLPQEAAQKVVDFAPKVIEKTLLGVQQAHVAEVNGWIAAAKTDKEFGGDKFAENMAVANKAFATFGTPELKDWLIKSGAGNNPELVRAFFRAGKAISADGFVPGGTTTTVRDAAAAIFDKSSMNP